MCAAYVRRPRVQAFRPPPFSWSHVHLHTPFSWSHLHLHTHIDTHHARMHTHTHIHFTDETDPEAQRRLAKVSAQLTISNPGDGSMGLPGHHHNDYADSKGGGERRRRGRGRSLTRRRRRSWRRGRGRTRFSTAEFAANADPLVTSASAAPQSRCAVCWGE